jgi:diguanylate cyclase
MNSLHIRSMRHQLERWRSESALVQDDAVAVDLVRARHLAPLVAALYGAMALVFMFLLLSAPDDDPTRQWKFWRMWLHLGSCVCLIAISVAANALQHSHRSWSGRNIGLIAVSSGIAFAIGEVAIEQWVTPNITAFLLVCVMASLAVYLQPMISGGLYGLAYVGFYVAMGWTQSHSQHLLSNRMSGLAVCGISWVLSVMLWRKFTVITLQRKQLEKANAELQQKQKELERLTRQDGLTGLFNRNTFTELSRSELARSQRQGSSTTIVLLDLDHFKRVNDTWGHPAGDAVLRHAATLTSSTVRSTDLVGRLGGEEFIVLLPNTAMDAGRRIAEKIRLRLESSVVKWEGNRIPVTASFGVSSTTAAEKLDFDHLYTEADKALYLAKHRGRNRVV